MSRDQDRVGVVGSRPVLTVTVAPSLATEIVRRLAQGLTTDQVMSELRCSMDAIRDACAAAGAR